MISARSTRSTLWVAGVAFVVLALYFGLSELDKRLHWAIFPWTRYEYHSSSMSPMEIRLGPETPPIILKIPRAHIAWLPDESANGTRFSVGLEPPLPAFGSHGGVEVRDDATNLPDRLYFSIEHQPIQDLIDSREAQSAGHLGFVFWRKRAGFDVYVVFQGPGVPPEERAENGVQQSLYLPLEDKEVSIRCEEGKRPAHGCELRFAVTNDITAMAIIPRSMIEKYDVIEQRIRAYVQNVEKQP
jgi:hypothetical protein